MIGQQVGKYRVTDRIGRGGMGTVYRAFDETLHRDVAIKVLNADLNDPAVARRFRAEAVAIARLNHPGIAKIYELFQHEGQWLMVMEFVRGETLGSLVVRQGPLPPVRSAELCIQALDALAHAHSMGVVHRDLKPGNLMLTAVGSVKIMDFGIARVAGTEHLTSAGFMIGTPAYMAPEQVIGKEIDARADLYALGVVIYYLGTAKLPFKGDTAMAMAQSRVKELPTPVRSVRQELPAWFGHVTERALARAPEDRFQTADEFRAALQRGTSGLPIVAPTAPLLSDTAPTVVWPPNAPTLAAPTRRRSIALALAAATVIVVGLAAYFWVRTSRTPGAVEPRSASQAVQETRPLGVPAGGSGTNPAPPASSGPVRGDSAQAGSGADRPVPVAGSTPRSAGDPPGSPVRARSGASPRASVPSSGREGKTARGPVPIDSILRFDNIRLLIVTGRRADDQDVVLYLGGGQISLMLRPNESVRVMLPYKDLQAATYVKARTPRWNPTLAAPPQNLDVSGGFIGIRPSRHWLVLQSAAAFVVLRLEDANYKQVLDAVATRTGVKIARPAPGG